MLARVNSKHQRENFNTRSRSKARPSSNLFFAIFFGLIFFSGSFIISIIRSSLSDYSLILAKTLIIFNYSYIVLTKDYMSLDISESNYYFLLVFYILLYYPKLSIIKVDISYIIFIYSINRHAFRH